jgi:hypothetical protein
VKRWARSVSLLLSLCCGAVSAATPASCELTADSLLPADRQPVFEFSQSKTIGTISRPLRSSGLLGLSSSGELLWQTRQPLKSTIVIDGGSIKVFNRDDVLVNTLSNASIRQMSDILLQVFSGDSAALASSFTSTASCADDGGWQLDLQPLTSELGKLLVTVTLAGHSDIETISFREARGDLTEIMLSPVARSRLDELERYLEF